MTHRSQVRLLAVMAVLSLSATACGGSAISAAGADRSAPASSGAAAGCPDNGTEGLTDTTIKLGVSQPMSGPLVAVGGGFVVGMNAYFNYVNSKGGIQGPDGKRRKVELIAKDDQYVATKTKANVSALISQDKVFAMLGLFGTSGNLAARPLLAKECVPSLFPTSGAPELGNPDYPWGGPAGSISYLLEAKATGEYLKSVNPNAKVAILHQEDDLGRAYLQGFKKGIANSNIEIVKTESFESTDPDVANQITSLAASGADTFYDIAIGLQAMQALNHVHASGWKPRILQAAQLGLSLLKKLQPGAGDGLIISTTAYDPDLPENADLPQIKLYLEWFEKTPGHEKQVPSTAVGGWTAGMLATWAIEHAKTMDRVGVMESAHNMEVTEPTIYLPGVKVRTGDGDDYLIEGVRQQRLDRAAGRLVPIGEVQDFDGTTRYEKITG
ncbi:ABC transporter substrate-binding protein [Streptosporangium sp. NPDC001681]|uniref:ABC transporter substrate-binding protein n=1 Tax=Streptosporangium sp. NPDC001681 TaxID=3154395 RepID=UPI00332DFDD4